MCLLRLVAPGPGVVWCVVWCHVFLPLPVRRLDCFYGPPIPSVFVLFAHAFCCLLACFLAYSFYCVFAYLFVSSYRSFVFFYVAVLTVLTDLQLPSGVRGKDAAVRNVGEVRRSPSLVLWIFLLRTICFFSLVKGFP